MLYVEGGFYMNIHDEIQEDKHIDPDALDVAWIEQANLFYKYSHILNEALEKKNDLKLELEYEKEQLDAIKARIDLEIRRNPENFDLPKLTESVVSSAIILQPEYKKALDNLYDKKKQFNEVQNRVNQLYSCVNTMEQRKSALENLGKLLTQQYFSSPESPRNLSWEYHNKTKRIKGVVKDKIKRRRKNE